MVAFVPLLASMVRGEGRPRLAFKDNHFTIVQFTDLHFGEAPEQPWGPEQDRKSVAIMHNVLKQESPDLVVLGGDQLTGLNIDKNATAYWETIVDTIESHHTPHTAILGNHDAEPHSGHGNQSQPGAFVNRTQLIEFDASRRLSLTQLGPPSLAPAVSVYVVDVWPEGAPKQGEVPRLQLFHLDSGGGGMPEEIYPQQIAWLNATIAARRARFRQIVPAMVFVHIPLAQFENAQILYT